MIERSDFFGYEKYVIRAGGLAVSVLTLGAAVCSIEYNGRPVALGYGTAQEYLDCESRAGAIIGRVAGRVAHARFSLGGREYPLAANDGENQLHGGPQSFDKRRWSAEVQCANRIRFALLSREGDNGYPGALAAAVSYSVDNDTLRIDFEAEASADTPFAPTSHIYFNLGGTPDILGTHLAVNAQQYQPLDAAGLPQGAPAPTATTSSPCCGRSAATTTTASFIPESRPPWRRTAASAWPCGRTSRRSCCTPARACRRPCTKARASVLSRRSARTVPTGPTRPSFTAASASTGTRNTASTAAAAGRSEP